MVNNVKTQVKHDRLYITLAGFFTDAQAKAASDQILAAIDAMPSEFDVITDISECRAATPGGTAEIQRIQIYALAKGARQFIRVVGQRVITQMQLDRASQKTGVSADYVATIAEAERRLERHP